ncbi:MAG TPA: hypothetical protein VGD67_23765 [Pseudonocardiaceae bacterium]
MKLSTRIAATLGTATVAAVISALCSLGGGAATSTIADEPPAGAPTTTTDGNGWGH